MPSETNLPDYVFFSSHHGSEQRHGDQIQAHASPVQEKSSLLQKLLNLLIIQLGIKLPHVSEWQKVKFLLQQSSGVEQRLRALQKLCY